MRIADDLDTIRATCVTPADAVRLACSLEATAPKAGNVYPGQSFADLHYRDFLKAAGVAAKHLCDSTRSFASRILNAAIETKSATGTNVNLGILLLLGPLVAIDESGAPLHCRDSMTTLLNRITPDDSRELFQAIAISSPGGLGKVDEMDVTDTQSHEDIVAAMRLAQSYDRIALQYSTGFADLTDNILPILYDSIREFSSLLDGIAAAHIRILARWPDSLIARKNGLEVARQVQQRAGQVDVYDANECQRFDESLRGDDHKLNPGSTADLIAAGLYLLLRTDR